MGLVPVVFVRQAHHEQSVWSVLQPESQVLEFRWQEVVQELAALLSPLCLEHAHQTLPGCRVRAKHCRVLRVSLIPTRRQSQNSPGLQPIQFRCALNPPTHGIRQPSALERQLVGLLAILALLAEQVLALQRLVSDLKHRVNAQTCLEPLAFFQQTPLLSQQNFQVLVE